MAGITPVPTTRITGLYAREALRNQLQSDQLNLFTLQQQISTGRRLILPSDDASSAYQAISIQRLLERKTQLAESVETGTRFLSATDSAIGQVADKLYEVKAATLQVVDTISSDQDRQAAIEVINGALDSLITFGNTQYRGRYLFAGSQTNVVPYEVTEDGVLYHGDAGTVESYLNIGVLYDMSISGQDVFGGFSTQVEGSVDLNPQLSEDTFLSDLNGGEGIDTNGAFTISDGFNTSTIDLNGAVTVGDVKRLIEENASPAWDLDVTLSGDGINLQMKHIGATLIVDEVGTGTTARELGIFTNGGVGTALSQGDDLNPIVRNTTELGDLLGTKARVVVESADSNNDILVEAAANGVAFNGVTVQFVDDASVTAGNEVVAYDDVLQTLTVQIDAGQSTANDVVAAINAEGTFTAEIDAKDSSSTALAGTGAVEAGTTAVTAGGIGQALNQTAGIQIVNGGKTYEITFDDAETVNDLLNIINGSGANVRAEISADGTGINVRSLLSGSDFQIGENGGPTATQLGIRSFNSDTELSSLNYGVGVSTGKGFTFSLEDEENSSSDDNDQLLTTEGTDLIIETIDGQTFQVDLSGDESIADVVDSINSVTGLSVTASEVSTGNVSILELTDNSVTGTGQFTVTQAEGSLAGQYLGLIPSGNSVEAAGNTLQGSDSDYTDLTIIDKLGQSYSVDLNAAETVGEVIDALNTALGGNVTARLAARGNGIELVDGTGGTGTLEIHVVPDSRAAHDLGLIAEGESSVSTTGATLTGEDRNYYETDSVFNSLIRLRDALEANDTEAISRAAEKLDDDISRLTFAQAAVGSQWQALEITQFSLEQEDIQLQTALSEEIEVDIVQAISDLTAQQISFEASLQVTGNLLQLSLLNFI